MCWGVYGGIGIEGRGYLKRDKLKEKLEGEVLEFGIVVRLGYEFKKGMKLWGW